MDEFIHTSEMIERIKDIACHAKMKVLYSKSGKVFDQDVAALLGINFSNLANMKRRNKPPLKEILQFCKRFRIDPMKILF